MVIVNLTDQELWMATQLGSMRAWQSQFLKSKDNISKHTYTESVRVHILGALGEAAFAKHLELYNPQTFNEWKGGKADVSKDKKRLEVRTRSNHDYDLIVRKDDDLSSIYILVTGDGNEMHIHGWIVGSKAAKKENVKNYGSKGDAFFVKAKDLNSIASLQGLLSNPTFTKEI